MAWEGFKEKPLLGWGQENFNLVFNKYYKPELYKDEPWFDRVHSIFFDWLIAGGILGLLAYLSIPLALLWVIWFGKITSITSVEKSLLTGLIAAYEFHNLFVFDNIISYIFFFTILAYVYSLTHREPKEGSVLSKEFNEGIIDRVVVPLVIIAVIFSVYCFNAKGIQASSTLIKALQPHNDELGNRDFGKNIEYFEKALAYDSFANQEIREQLGQAASRMSNLQVPLEIKEKFFDLAQTEIKKQIASAPDDIRHILFLGSVYDSFGQYEEAQKYFRAVYEMSPNKQLARFALGMSLINTGKYDEALVLFKETVELDEGYDQAHLLYATAAVYTKQIELSDEILRNKFGEVLINNSGLINAYIISGYYNRAKEILIGKIASNPADYQSYLSLADVYIKSGERQKAIIQLEKLIEIKPDFKDQGEWFIGEIKAGRNP